jgi:hypothetical protein
MVEGSRINQTWKLRAVVTLITPGIAQYRNHHGIRFLYFCSWQIYPGSLINERNQRAEKCTQVRTWILWTLWIFLNLRRYGCLSIWDMHKISEQLRPFLNAHNSNSQTSVHFSALSHHLTIRLPWYVYQQLKYKKRIEWKIGDDDLGIEQFLAWLMSRSLSIFRSGSWGNLQPLTGLQTIEYHNLPLINILCDLFHVLVGSWDLHSLIRHQKLRAIVPLRADYLGESPLTIPVSVGSPPLNTRILNHIITKIDLSKFWFQPQKFRKANDNSRFQMKFLEMGNIVNKITRYDAQESGVFIFSWMSCSWTGCVVFELVR